jgi:energy-coupling factor transporter ATP-binding protein EcfA2
VRLDNFEIANVGPHRSVSFTIAPGINLLTGRNGTGKSTLLHCLEASVTGDYGVFVGTKPENVNVLAGKRAPSYFRAHWHHAGHDLDILRHLGNTKPELRIDGGNAQHKALFLEICAGYEADGSPYRDEIDAKWAEAAAEHIDEARQMMPLAA